MNQVFMIILLGSSHSWLLIQWPIGAGLAVSRLGSLSRDCGEMTGACVRPRHSPQNGGLILEGAQTLAWQSQTIFRPGANKPGPAGPG
ncbi:MAG: hypothetical protein AABZ76_15675 [Pseudomonadota bacterium]